MSIVVKPRSPWVPTGWLCATGVTIEMSIYLPAGVSARVHRKTPGIWQYAIRRGYPEKLIGRYTTKTRAMSACESALKVELQSAMRILRKTD